MKILLIVILLFVITPASSATKEEVEKKVRDLVLGDRGQRLKAAKFLNSVPQKVKDKVIEKMEKGLDEFKKQMPMVVDDVTTMTLILYSSTGMGLFYEIQIDKIKYGSSKYDDFFNTMKNRLIESQCRVPLSAMYLLYGRTVSTYYHYSVDDSLMMWVNIQWSDCEARS